MFGTYDSQDDFCECLATFVISSKQKPLLSKLLKYKCQFQRCSTILICKLSKVVSNNLHCTLFAYFLSGLEFIMTYLADLAQFLQKHIRMERHERSSQVLFKLQAAPSILLLKVLLFSAYFCYEWQYSCLDMIFKKIICTSLEIEESSQNINLRNGSFEFRWKFYLTNLQKSMDASKLHQAQCDSY